MGLPTLQADAADNNTGGVGRLRLPNRRDKMPLYDLTEFLRLSSVLNYNLSAASLNRYNVLMFIMGEKKLDQDEKKDRNQKGIIMEALSYLFSAYSHKRRRLGPKAVLHPLRATALFTRALEKLDFIDILTTLFHDIIEDIEPTGFDNPKWREMESQLYHLFGRLELNDEAQLVERLMCLTRLEVESYYEYIGRLLKYGQTVPQIVQIKLADRLDNTLDMRIDLRDPLDDIDFFQKIFQIMFVSTYQGYTPKTEHPPSAALNGARRLYQLFKNAVLLSLIRRLKVIPADRALQVLFLALSDASLKEAQRTLIHLLGYHYKDLAEQRYLLMEAMEYCYSGRSDLVTKPNGKRMLDGLFSTYFGHKSSKVRNKKLDILYQNKALMLEASVAFIVIFLSFLNDPAYYVKGISAKGIYPK